MNIISTITLILITIFSTWGSQFEMAITTVDRDQDGIIDTTGGIDDRVYQGDIEISGVWAAIAYGYKTGAPDPYRVAFKSPKVLRQDLPNGTETLVVFYVPADEWLSTSHHTLRLKWIGSASQKVNLGWNMQHFAGQLPAKPTNLYLDLNFMPRLRLDGDAYIRPVTDEDRFFLPR